MMFIFHESGILNMNHVSSVFMKPDEQDKDKYTVWAYSFLGDYTDMGDFVKDKSFPIFSGDYSQCQNVLARLLQFIESDKKVISTKELADPIY